MERRVWAGWAGILEGRLGPRARRRQSAGRCASRGCVKLRSFPHLCFGSPIFRPQFPHLWCITNRLVASSVQFSRSVVSDSLPPHESQHTRPPCPSPTPGVYSNSCPPSWWCHPAISSSVVPFSSCPQSLPASGSFPLSQRFAWGGQSTGASASAGGILAPFKLSSLHLRE